MNQSACRVNYLEKGETKHQEGGDEANRPVFLMEPNWGGSSLP
jgi:hypothetical protein